MEKVMYGVVPMSDRSDLPATATMWGSQEKAENHAQQLALSNNVDVTIYAMTKFARVLRHAHIERFDNVTREVRMLTAPIDDAGYIDLGARPSNDEICRMLEIKKVSKAVQPKSKVIWSEKLEAERKGLIKDVRARVKKVAKKSKTKRGSK